MPASEKLLFRGFGTLLGPARPLKDMGRKRRGKKPESANKLPAGPLFRRKNEVEKKAGGERRARGAAGGALL